MTKYKLVTAVKDGQTKTFQALSRYNDIGWWFTGEIRNGEGTIEEILKSHGWAVTKIEDLPDHYVTERKTWDVKTTNTLTLPVVDHIVLEVSDSVKEFSCRLVVNGVPSRWHGTKANEAVSHDGRYAWFWDYWDGYFPTNVLVELKQHGSGTSNKTI